VRPGAWTVHEFEPSIPEAARLSARLRKLGFPERTPAVREKVDTADVWLRVVLSAALDGRESALALHLLPSGFEGEDAEAIREVFRQVLAVAGVRPEDQGPLGSYLGLEPWPTGIG
jgi:hypothetical protein